MTLYKALQVSQNDNGDYQKQIVELDDQELPAGEVLIEVSYSSLNYKDGLSASGNPGVTRNYPHTPGIDAAGTVVESSSGDFVTGQQVLLFGYDLGMNTSGGFGQRIRVPAKWVVACPQQLELRTAMVWGTAGITAALCVEKLLQMGLQPEQGVVAVSGATGGVGSVAVMLLAKLGFDVAAITGSEDQAQWLTQIGAMQIIPRSQFGEPNKRPLLQEQFAGVVDTVGGDMLANLLKSVKHSGSVACCGLVASAKLDATVLPFILRNVNLLGVDSVELPLANKQAIWSKIAEQWSLPELELLAKDVVLAELPDYLDKILLGKTQGRIVVNLQ